MSRMHKALENLRLEGQTASRVQQSRRPVSPRVAAAIRSKLATATISEILSPPTLLFSAPLLAGHENDCLSVHEKTSVPVEAPGRVEAPTKPDVLAPEEPPIRSIAILGDDIASAWGPAASPEDRSNAVFASLALDARRPIVVENEAVETAAPISVVVRDDSQVSSSPAVVQPTPVVAPADMLLNAIVLKRPSRAFRLDRQATDQLVASKATVELHQQESPPPARVVNDIAASEIAAKLVAATEWELESSRELADSVRYGQYAEVLRCIRRDVRSTKTPVIACCSVEADAQTADLVHRVATIAAKGETAKVLIVDANQSASRMTDELDLADAAGFIDALSRGMSVDELVRPTSQAGIFVLPLGDGAIEHLGIARKRLAALVQRWRKEYGLVLMDVGPMSAQLAGLISGGCDGAYVSVQLGTTLAFEAEKRIKQFRTDGVNLLGCIALQPQ